MRKKTFIALYSLTLFASGVLIVLLGFSFGDIKTFSELSGSEEFILLIKFIGGGMSTAGLGGLIWTLMLSKNPTLPGYAGLNGPGLATFIVPLFLAGPFWLLVAWVLWLIPTFRAHNSIPEG